MDASEATTSPAVQWIGRIGAPVFALTVWWALPAVGGDGVSESARATASVIALIALLWMTEALPLPATSLLPIVLLPVMGVTSVTHAAAPYADRFVFLFMGGFMLALGMERWGLHRRIALRIVLGVGAGPLRLIGGFMLASAVLSMWVSNTATTVMMLPIGMSVVALVRDRLGEDRDGARHDTRNFATCLMLGIAYAASIGGVGTLIGTPPNVVLAGTLEKTLSIELGFVDWMMLGVPLSMTFLVIAWIVLTRFVYPVRLPGIPGGRAMIRGELEKLGRPSRGEWSVFIVFVLTASAWVLREPLLRVPGVREAVPALGRIDDSVIAIAAAVALFAIPVDGRRGVFALDWRTAVRLPWGVLLLFGGGLSLAAAMQESGLDRWIGERLGGLGDLPSPVLVLIVTASIVFLSEIASNTAIAAAFLPILASVGLAAGIDPVMLMVPAAVAASYAFMLPVGTPPNAIVFGSGHVTMGQMVRAGVWLNLIAIGLIMVAAYTLVPLALPSAGTGP